MFLCALFLEERSLPPTPWGVGHPRTGGRGNSREVRTGMCQDMEDRGPSYGAAPRSLLLSYVLQMFIFLITFQNLLLCTY